MGEANELCVVKAEPFLLSVPYAKQLITTSDQKCLSASDTDAISQIKFIHMF